MSNFWFNKLDSSNGDYSCLSEAITHFEKEITEAKKDIKVKGSVSKQAAELPGIITYRYNQLQELEAMLQFLNIKLTVAKSSAYRRYLEAYNRGLSSKDAGTYADGDISVYSLAELINQIALVRNQFLGIMKGLDAKHWQINNLVKLKAAGFEDFEVDG